MAGLLPPSVALNDMLVGLRFSVGSAATVNVTGTVCGELVAFGSATVIIAL